MSLAGPASAQTGPVGEAIQACILPADGPLDIDAALANAARFDCSRDQRHHGPGNFWAISEPLDLHSTSARPLILRSASLWQGNVTLRILYGDGHVESNLIDGHGLSRRIQLGAIAQFDLPPRDAPITRLFWQIDDSANLRGVLLATRIATIEEGGRSNLMMATLYALFAGLSFALIVYNLALWGALRHPFQLAYCAMVAMLLAYSISGSGALAWFYPAIENNDRIRINHLLLCMAACAALIFARRFFEPDVFRGWAGRLTNVAAALIASIGIFFVAVAPTNVILADKLFSWGFMAVLTTVPVILWRAWTLKSNYLWLFAIAWAAPIVMAGARIVQNLGLIEWRFWLDNSTIIAMACEALLSSAAIAYRIRVLSRERDFAVAQEAVQRRLADTDPLTGLLNRRAFLNEAIGRPGMQQLLLIDIDHFKAVNETLGHDGGDEVLRVFARVLRQVAPDDGLVARLGGEEFALLSPPGSEIDPDALLARLRAARMPFDLDVTASIGVCRGGIVREADWKSIYRAADRALFDAKAAGRDRVRRGETLLAEAA